MATRSINKKIEKHSDVVVSICKFEKLDVMVTASASGEIMTWNTNKLEIVDFHKLKDIYIKFKGKLVGILASKDYLIISKYKWSANCQFN